MNPMFWPSALLLSALLCISPKSYTAPTIAPSQQVMKAAKQAFDKAQRQGMDSDIMAIIDLSKPSSEKRFWLIDMNTKQVLEHTWVAHGQQSGGLYAKDFANTQHSHKTAIGVYQTLSAYHGKHGLSLRLKGLDGAFNDAALKRHIVIHSAPYVSQASINQMGRLGRSWGCFVLSPNQHQSIIDQLSQKPSLLIAYYPDSMWLKHSKWIEA